MNDVSVTLPACSRLLAAAGAALPPGMAPEDVVDYFRRRAESPALPPFMADLARVELAAAALHGPFPDPVPDPAVLTVNPTLSALPVSWRGLPEIIAGSDASPVPADAAFVLLWLPPNRRPPVIRTATGRDLLALKIALEEIDPRDASRDGGVSLGAIEGVVDDAVEEGLLLAPPSQIRRPSAFPRGTVSETAFYASPVFTLQWHITQRCDLHCKHCYDRSDRDKLTSAQAMGVLEDFYAFCRAKHVSGQISFSGGNPFLCDYFTDIYRRAAALGFMTAILGNPVSRLRLEEIAAIRHPEFFQVSLEGLRAKNDDIRGRGHFDRTMDFLGTLKDLGIYAMVMLTLTDDNAADLLPLAEHLRGRADLFTYNRLACVGEGAALRQVAAADYPDLVQRYLAAASSNPVIGLKDSLINIRLEREGRGVFGGCTGHGCGAAFNFAALLPDGDVHACRKFPSPIGNILNTRFIDIYDGDAARRYRSGAAACRDCRLRPVCGGCMAVVHGSGGDVTTDRDPHCFIDGAC